MGVDLGFEPAQEGLAAGPRPLRARTQIRPHPVELRPDVPRANCTVIGLTSQGAPDAAFGTAGIAPVEAAPGESVYCQSLVAQDDGRLLLAGNAAGHGFASRLLANGARDPAFAADAASLPRIEFTDTKLDNGLRVILAVDHSAPVVAVNVIYNVGSRDERPGRTGFAHLFEHMMFQGSENVGKG